MQLHALLAILSLSALFGACIKDSTTKIDKGSEGESCTRRDDCADGLSCLDSRCTASSSGATGSDGGQAVVAVATGGQAGESCTRRADCQTGLACMDQTCVEDTDLTFPDASVPSQRGDRGETCAARNDCKDTLACVAGRCRENNFDIAVQRKECVRVECKADPDCCANFVAPSYCAGYKTSCDAGQAIYCSAYATSCICARVCEDSLCVTANRCASDTDCGSALHCVAQECVQCAVQTDCLDSKAQCVSGICKTGCMRDEECPLFFACQQGACVDVGCTSNRECYFSTRDPRSTCVKGECFTPCENDAECTGQFQACESSRCVDVGCETDSECRVALGLQNLPSSSTATAACRTPTP